MGSRHETQTFTVIIIDDKEVCCRRIKQKIQGIRKIGDGQIRVEAKTVHVGVQQGGESDPKAWTFTTATMKALNDAAESPPDLLIVDYIYIDDGEAADLKHQALHRLVSRTERESRSLGPRDLRDWVEDRAPADGHQRRKIIERIFDSKGPLYLHSYTPRDLKDAVGTVQERGNDAVMAFRNAESSLHVLDTRDLLFADDEFDKSEGQTHYDRNYYAYLLGVLFDEIVQKEAYRRSLHRSKYLRFKRSAPMLAEIGAIGAGVGLAASAAGSFVFELFREGYVLGAFATLALCVVVAIPLGWIVARLFETLMARLLPSE
jgi:hypothetical protein